MRKVEVTTGIQTTPEKVIAAFVEFDMLRQWWLVERALIQKNRGGAYTLAWNISDKGIGYVATGIVKEYDPGATLVVDNFTYLNPERSILGPMTLTVNAFEKSGRTEIFLCQDGYRHGTDWDWYYEAVRQSWPAVLKTLKEYLENNT